MSCRNFLSGDRASHDDAIVETRDELSKKQTALIALRQLQIWTRDRLPGELVVCITSEQRTFEIGVNLFQFAKMSAQNAADLVLDCLAREGRIETFETNGRRFFRA